MTESAPSSSDLSTPLASNDPRAHDAGGFLVVGVAACSGGLDCIERLLEGVGGNLPMAVVVQAREERSLDIAGLAQRTSLKVVEARDGTPIQVGIAHLIPDGAHMTVLDGRLRVQPRRAPSSHVQVDQLFRSLAEQYRERAVGVVLSGGATDGAAGLREIKAVGGITIAQRPEQSDGEGEGDGMRAEGTSVADIVLPIEEIGRELVRLAELPQFPAKASLDVSAPATEEIYAAIFRLLRRATGVDFSHYKRPTIARRMARRMALRRVTSLASYAELLKRDSAEVQSLQEDVLIHVTSFFREPESFEAVKESIFPRLLVEREDGPIRIWVPGCSTGEEVYSLAIVLFETLEDEAAHVPIQFFGTDISKAAIEKARAGVYSDAAVADIPPERLRRFFSKVDAGYQIGKAIRERCVFARQDITRDPPFSRLNLIVCRNTLIYLGQAIQRRVISMMHYALKPNGFLMLGRAETTGANADLFATFDKRAKIYRKKPSASVPDFDFQPAPFEPSIMGAGDDVARPVAPRASRPWDMQAEADRLLLDRYAPPAVVVDASFRIISARGQTAPFLELPTGEASLDVLKMVRPSLLVALRNALQEARHTRVTAREHEVSLLTEEQEELINIEARPIGSLEAPHFLITFERIPRLEAKPRTPTGSDGVSNGDSSGPSAQLLRELAATREQLHANIHELAAANEELQSANEEILSSNEELQSTNEELDTAKEELQSTNEELSTLNEELHGRNEDLSHANSDLANLLASVQIPIVMVASDLSVRRFTPAAQRLFNLIPSDIGRPIAHIRPNLSAIDLDRPIAEVIDTMIAYEREVEDDAGRAYLLRIRPYKSVDNRVDGAVLALLDVSAAREALSLATRTTDAVIFSVPEPILVLDSSFVVTRANAAFCSSFQLKVEDVQHRPLQEIGHGAFDIPQLRQVLEVDLNQQSVLENVTIEHAFPSLGRRQIVLDARRVESGRHVPGVTLLVIRELRTTVD